MKAPAELYRLGAAPNRNLGPIDASLRDVPPARPGLLRIAVHRSLGAPITRSGAWQQTADGSPLWRLSISSTNAVGLRLHFANFSVGPGQVWVHDTSSPPKQVFGPYTGKGRNGDGDFWTEVVFSDEVEVEYRPAAGAAARGQPPFLLPELSHLWQFGGRTSADDSRPSWRITGGRNPEAAGTAANINTACFLDASCYNDPNSGTYVPAVNSAVRGSAFIVFGDSTGSYQCTATLLNAPNASPLLLTAGHCIDSQTLARSLVAVFDAVDTSCQQPPFAAASNAQLVALPQASGVQMLSFAEQPFLNENSLPEVETDLDYSLVLLNDFPAWGNVQLSGYSASPVAAGQELVSVSAPQGFFFKAAFSTVLPSLWLNGFDVDQTMQGRIDSGSSGSGVFDANGHLVGLLSTGSSPCANPSNCPNQDSCDVRGEFTATYTSFNSIYPIIRNYLNDPLDGVGVALPSNPSVFSASPITNLNGAGYGDSTLTFNAGSGVTAVEIHVGTPNGALFFRGGPTGSASAPGWVQEGMTFYLQNISANQPRTLANTLATATAHIGTATFTATPPVILSPDPSGFNIVTVKWNVPAAATVEVHVGGWNGPLFTRGNGSGSATTGKWVADGTTFTLCNVSSGPCSPTSVLSSLTVHVASDAQKTAGAGGPALVAFPNPTVVPAGQMGGVTTLYWRAPGANVVELRVGSATGPLFAEGTPSGAAGTGPWIVNGITFYLQDVSNGRPGTTVATATVAANSQ